MNQRSGEKRERFPHEESAEVDGDHDKTTDGGNRHPDRSDCPRTH
jgi:hypothetical protein